MKHILMYITILITSCFGIITEANAKGHKLMTSVKFDGKVKKKLPSGEGTLIFERHGYEGDPFLINGLFKEDTIKNASVKVNGSTLFSGDFK